MEIISITIPIFIFVAAGYIAKRIGVIGDETKNFLSKLVYYFAFPALTFRSIVASDFASTFKFKLVLSNLLSTTAMFLLTFVLAFLIKNAYKRGAFNMGSFRNNQGYMGMPIVNGFYGESAMSKAAVINGFDSALVVILSVFALEVFRSSKKRAGEIQKVGRISKPALQVFSERFASFITNPFVLSAVLGIVFAYLNIPVLKFKFIDEVLKQIGTMALPMALLSIGCSIEVKHLRSNLKIVLVTSIFKLVAAPIVAFSLAYFAFGLRGTDLGISILLVAMPSSISSYVMACEMDTDEDLMATIIGVTTFVSVLSISITQYILQTFLL